MTSLDIALRAGVRHDNVSRLIRRELDAIEVNHLKFEAVYIAGNGASRRCYCLPGEYLLHVLTAFDAKLRFALIKHWQAVNEGWVQRTKNIVEAVTTRLVMGGRASRRLELEQAEMRAEHLGTRLTARERRLILLP